MAHRFRIKVRPHINKDGSSSPTKKDYEVIDRNRQGARVVGVAGSKKAAEQLIADERQKIIAEHIEKHPDDQHFRNKVSRSRL